MAFDAKPATRFYTQLYLDSILPELLYRHDSESDNDDDLEGNGMDIFEGDGEVDVEGEGEDGGRALKAVGEVVNCRIDCDYANLEKSHAEIISDHQIIWENLSIRLAIWLSESDFLRLFLQMILGAHGRRQISPRPPHPQPA